MQCRLLFTPSSPQMWDSLAPMAHSLCAVHLAFFECFLFVRLVHPIPVPLGVLLSAACAHTGPVCTVSPTSVWIWWSLECGQVLLCAHCCQFAFCVLPGVLSAIFFTPIDNLEGMHISGPGSVHSLPLYHTFVWHQVIVGWMMICTLYRENYKSMHALIHPGEHEKLNWQQWAQSNARAHSNAPNSAEVRKDLLCRLSGCGCRQ